ncbi:MAG: hypothetical protein KME11_12095 [Timaviella obliquedivisa GSE-PSE-MK23-08B]|jgi:hypothetical protein|nr:hypothetical protein [Timaviella obliquedivisa GSE-PSE-MK23-08B]
MQMKRLRIFFALGIGLIGITPCEAIEAIAFSTSTQAVQADLTSRVPRDALLRHRSAQLVFAQSTELAQNAELGCRQTNVSTGVYVQPNLDSASQGILPPAQTVRLESKGEGWARINQPLIGWVQSRYLTPSVSCDPLNGAASNDTAGNSAASNGTGNGTTTIQNSPRQQIIALPPTSPASPPQPDLANSAPVKVTCDVLPANGLVVRSEPTVSEQTYLTTLAPGTHEFQFTRDARITQSEAGDRRWVYITAPATGWITLGLEGAPTNLGGQECG